MNSDTRIMLKCAAVITLHRSVAVVAEGAKITRLANASKNLKKNCAYGDGKGSEGKGSKGRSCTLCACHLHLTQCSSVIKTNLSPYL